VEVQVEVQAPVQVLAIPHEEAVAEVALVQGRLPTQLVGLLRFLLIDMPLPCLPFSVVYLPKTKTAQFNLL
jgi:hypothetical protein